MGKHEKKRIKALPVCSETLQRKCAISKSCTAQKCDKTTKCAAAELIDHHFEVNGKPDKCTLVNCLCACFKYSGIGCPYFRKAVDT